MPRAGTAGDRPTPRRKKERCRIFRAAHPNRWVQSQTLTAYLEAVEQQAGSAKLSPDAQQTHATWMAWARAHARRLDPLSDGLPFETTSRDSAANATD